MQKGLVIKPTKKRIFEIDFVRGLAIIMVLVYHFCYDITLLPLVFGNYYSMIQEYHFIAQIVGYVNSVLFTDYMYDLVLLFSGILLFITGISCSFSHSNIRRGFRALLLGFGITAVTWIASMLFKEPVNISFGILHCIGFSILFAGLMELIFRRLKVSEDGSFWFLIGVLLITIGVMINVYTSIPVIERKNFFDLIKIALGLASENTDWFPILPFSGVVFIGIAAGKFFYSQKKSLLPGPDGWQKIFAPINFLGRHTLVIYIVHQVFYLIFFFVVFSLLGFRF